MRNISLDINTSQTNYQVLIELNTSNFDYSHANESGNDIRFNQLNGSSLDYWIENWSTAGQSKIWVEVKSINTSKFEMYYDNPSANSENSGDNTFDFFDNFVSHDYNFSTNSSSLFVGIQPSVIHEGSEYWIYYNDASNNIYRRIGTDETTFGSATLISGLTGKYVDVWKNDSIYRMVYSDASLANIRLATSNDGITFTDQGILISKGTGTWDSYYIFDPMEIKIGSTYYLYYVGRDCAACYGHHKIGLATSPNGSVGNYTKQGIVLEPTANEWDSYAIQDPDVIEYDTGKYIMFYSAMDSGATYHKIGYALSINLSTWTKFADNPVLWATKSFENSHIFEPTVLIENDKYKFWYRTESANNYIGYSCLPQKTDKLPNSSVQKWENYDYANISNGELKLSSINGDRYFYSVSNFSSPKIVSFRTKENIAGGETTQAFECGFTDKSNDNRFEYGTYNSSTYQLVVNSSGVGGNTNSSVLRNTIYKKHELRWNNSVIQYYINDEYKIEDITDIPFVALKPTFRVYNTNSSEKYLNIDWIVVRKYNFPELTTMIGIEESNIPPPVQNPILSSSIRKWEENTVGLIIKDYNWLNKLSDVIDQNRDLLINLSMRLENVSTCNTSNLSSKVSNLSAWNSSSPSGKFFGGNISTSNDIYGTTFYGNISCTSGHNYLADLSINQIEPLYGTNTGTIGQTSKFSDIYATTIHGNISSGTVQNLSSKLQTQISNVSTDIYTNMSSRLNNISAGECNTSNISSRVSNLSAWNSSSPNIHTIITNGLNTLTLRDVNYGNPLTVRDTNNSIFFLCDSNAIVSIKPGVNLDYSVFNLHSGNNSVGSITKTIDYFAVGDIKMYSDEIRFYKNTVFDTGLIIEPMNNNDVSIGTNNKNFSEMYAGTFHGNLSSGDIFMKYDWILKEDKKGLILQKGKDKYRIKMEKMN